MDADPPALLRLSHHSGSGLLIAFEGIDGAGKTTQALRLAATLDQWRFRVPAIASAVVLSKEPTNGPHGRRLRESAVTGRLAPEEEFAAFVADRRQHVAELIQPALAAGKAVVLDRYYYSSAAYQGVRGLDWREIMAANEAFAPTPDVMLYLDLDPEIAVGRVTGRDGKANDFERVGDLHKARAIFQQISGPRVHRIDATQSPDAVATEVNRAVVRVILDRNGRRNDWASRESLQEAAETLALLTRATPERL